MALSSTPASTPFLGTGNPILGRELRQTLRNERAFALLAIYVSILGAVVAAQFPADQVVAVGQGQPGSGAGYDLFWTFCQAQAFFVVAVLPALAAGSLSQERERGTLESFLLTPLTAREIVWGKAAGVLCFGGLLLAATLPLTSLSFLLGGVSPMDIVTAYVVLLALAAFVTGFGLYCSARWTNAVRATVACYALLPFAISLLVVFMGPGSIIAGVGMIGGGFMLGARQLPRWKSSRVGKRLGPLADIFFYSALVLLFVAVVMLLAGSYGLGLRLFMLVFVTPYLLWVAKLGLERTGDELSRHRDPEGPARERLEDLRKEWQNAVAPPAPYVAMPTGRYTYQTQVPSPEESQWASLEAPKPAPAAVIPAPQRTVEIDRTPKTKTPGATYNVRAFLPDNLNPVFARALRSGFLGRGLWLARVAYGALIFSQLWLVLQLGLPLLSGDAAFESAWRGAAQSWPGLARLHLMCLMMAGAVFGARALAPEREQQTLPQLLTTPLPHRTIVAGKLWAALVPVAYVFACGVPGLVLLCALSILTPARAGQLFALQIVMAFFATAWGLLCSMRGLTSRRALGWSLGGLASLIGGEMILSNLVNGSGELARALHFLPLALVPDASANFRFALQTPALFAIALGVYSALAALFLLFTALDFKSYAAHV